jgi:UDP-glucose 4-epimerase
MRILVTGSSGFIGRNLLDLLDETPHEVIPFDIAINKCYDVAGPSLPDVAPLFRKADAVIHLAAEGGVIDSINNPGGSFHTNVIGTYHTLELAKEYGVEKVLVASTAGALLGNRRDVNEHCCPHPISPYGASKEAAEAYCAAFARSLGMNVNILRFANVYGPQGKHKRGAVSSFMSAIRAGQPIRIRGAGTQIRDFVHVHDICRGILTALEEPTIPGSIYHFGTGGETSIRQLANMVVNAAGMDYWPMRHDDWVPGEIVETSVDHTKARRELGWRPVIPLSKGLDRLWEQEYE